MTLEILSYIQILIVTIRLCSHVLGCIVSCIGHCSFHPVSLHESCLSRFAWVLLWGSICSPGLGSVPWVEWDRDVDSYR